MHASRRSRPQSSQSRRFREDVDGLQGRYVAPRISSLLVVYECSLAELSSDITIRSHLAALYDTLLEQNLLRIVEPYSVVEVEYVAKQVGQDRRSVEAK